MACPNCATEFRGPFLYEVRRAARKDVQGGCSGPRHSSSLALLGSALAWPIRKRRERIRWLIEAATPGRLSTLFRG